MMKISYLPIFILLVVLSSCASQRDVDPAKVAQVNAWLEQGQYHIELTHANPQVGRALQQVANSGVLAPGNTANSINLVGSTSYIRMENDTLTGYLPYYGERQVVNSRSDSGAIEFKGIPKNYSESFEADKQLHQLRFEIGQIDSNENYQIRIEIYPNQKVAVSIHSTQRRGITYDGYIKALEE